MTIDSKLERAKHDIPPEAGEPRARGIGKVFFFCDFYNSLPAVRAGMPISSEQSRLGLRQVAIGGGVLVTGSPALVVSRISS